MTDSASGFHHSRPSRAVAEPTCWSKRSIQTSDNNHTQPAARRVNQQAYTQLHSTASPIRTVCRVYRSFNIRGHVRFAMPPCSGHCDSSRTLAVRVYYVTHQIILQHLKQCRVSAEILGAHVLRLVNRM
jgi:hypothetical protein